MAKKAAKVVAEIALYGAPHVGHGYIAHDLASGRMFGEGGAGLRGSWSATCALWNAAADLRNAGVASGLCEVHAVLASGPAMALVDLSNVPGFGSLVWGPGRVYVLSAEKLLAAAEAP